MKFSPRIFKALLSKVGKKKKKIISKLSWKLLEIILGQIVLVFQENHQEDLLLWEYKQSSSLEMDETFIQL